MRTSDQASGSGSAQMTPMMAQYFEIKSVNPGYLLFYRMGDFYELFFEDAEIASAALGIVLTKRGQHLGSDIPMCGVPVHAADTYLKKLIGLGHLVAICEQIEDPAEAKKRGAKSVVKRDVVRLVTPGTLTEDDLLAPQANNFLASVARLSHGADEIGLAWADISTGELFVCTCSSNDLADLLAAIAPSEILIEAELAGRSSHGRPLLAFDAALHLSTLPAENFDSEAATAQLLNWFPELDALQFARVNRAALGALLAHVAETQKGARPFLNAPVEAMGASVLSIDMATRASLELLQTNRGDAKGSLRHAVDLCVTNSGSRLLAARLASPSTDIADINGRLDMVEAFVAEQGLAQAIRQALRALPDIARALGRLTLDRGGPRDLQQIGSSLAGAETLGALIGQKDLAVTGLSLIRDALNRVPRALAAEIGKAIEVEPPALAKSGGFVAAGFDKGLDEARFLATEGRSFVAALQSRLIEETGIKPLKIKHNNVLGYFIEVPTAHGDRLMNPEAEGAGFIHRQSMANAMRFTNKELADLEGRIAAAQETAVARELEIYAQLVAAVLAQTELLRQVGVALAELDLVTALGTLAAERAYVRPQVDGSLAFEVKGGRHPVVERMLDGGQAGFVVNDCDLSGTRAGGLWLVTGPNMGGKSTFLRQNALIVVLAQMGSFVPAASVHLGVVDRLFSRVGAADDIAHGRSTFMVEMVETAAILNRATNRSFVILDEIGRGTATFDGLSIAWATAEALHESNGCRALFATHFHELQALVQRLDRASIHTMKVKEWQEDVVFLHEVMDGAADRSYGIQVARLAGLPPPVVARAREILAQLEAQPSGTGGAMLDELPLFQHKNTPVKEIDPISDILDATRPDELTPRSAIELIYELKKIRDEASRR